MSTVCPLPVQVNLVLKKLYGPFQLVKSDEVSMSPGRTVPVM